MKLNYKQKIFSYFCLLLTLFTLCILLFEHAQAKRYKTEALEDRLEVYANTLYKSIQKDSLTTKRINELVALFPEHLRVTVANLQGSVVYDNTFSLEQVADNHLLRPELLLATQKGKGSHIRRSQTNQVEYLYFAKLYPKLYIRVALPYDIQVKEILRANTIFIYFILLIFILSLYSIYVLAKRLTQSIEQLRDFAKHPDPKSPPLFPDDELGEVASRVIENYQKLEQSKAQTTLEKERLLQHVHTSEEGICFFTPQAEVEYYNSLFMHYLNTMLEHKSVHPQAILSDPLFAEVKRFLDQPKSGNYLELVLKRQGRPYNIRVNIFEDKSFEIIINDITKQEKTRQLKQEMTSNIAHELRTPITSIRGYLETICEQNLDSKQKDYFTQKAFQQVINLSLLIDDMSLISKIEEAPHSFNSETCSLHDLVDEVKSAYQAQLHEQRIMFFNQISSSCQVEGNKNLLYTVFRNLVENTLKYGGEMAHIHISCYNEDEEFYYFSYADEGVGIAEEQHLNRLFERFYRISAGRTRQTGGTGLGLSIVKNTILLHGGTIIAKNRASGGLEFLFTLRK